MDIYITRIYFYSLLFLKGFVNNKKFFVIFFDGNTKKKIREICSLSERKRKKKKIDG